MDSQAASLASSVPVPLDAILLLVKRLAAEGQLKTLANLGSICKSVHELVRPILWKRVQWTEQDWTTQLTMRNEKSVRENWACVECLFLSADFHVLMNARFVEADSQDSTIPSDVLSIIKGDFPILRMCIHRASKETAAPSVFKLALSAPTDQWTVWLKPLHWGATVLQDVAYALNTICATPPAAQQTNLRQVIGAELPGFETRKKQKMPVPFKYESMPTLTTFHCTSARNKFDSLSEYLKRQDDEALADATIQLTGDANIRFRLMHVDDDKDHFVRIYLLFRTMNKIYRSKWRFTTVPFRFDVRYCALPDIQEWLNVLAWTENPYPETPLRYRMSFHLAPVDSHPPFAATMQQVHQLLKTLHADPEIRDRLPNQITVHLEYSMLGNDLDHQSLLTATFDLSDDTDFRYDLDRDYQGSGVTAKMEEGVRMSLHGVSENGVCLPFRGGFGGR